MYASAISSPIYELIANRHSFTSKIRNNVKFVSPNRIAKR